jgi:TonB family protein
MRACLVLLIVFCAHIGSAQTITGTVYDPSGAVVAGARVLLMVDYVKQAETQSGSAGDFRFGGLRAQLYHVQIKQPRFSLYQSHVDLRERPSAHLYAMLPLANMGEAMAIGGQALAPVAGPARASRVPAVGGQVEPARVARRVNPAYPASVQQRGVTGSVVIHIRITAEGRVTEPLVLDSPDAELAAATLASVAQWQYEPMRLNGVPVACEATNVFEFGAP